MRNHPRFIALLALLSFSGYGQAETTGATGFANYSVFDLTTRLARSLPAARLRYLDRHPLQFGDLWLPDRKSPDTGFPTIVFLHGGAWRADLGKDYTEPFAEALAAAGYAVWDLEYRRLGNRGGGYPGTFNDVGAGIDQIRALAESYPLDLSRVVLMGHSSGGHLALWAAGRSHIDIGSELATVDPLIPAGVVSIAGVNDLGRSLADGGRTDVLELLGVASAADGKARFAAADPAQLLPLGVPQALLIGTQDAPWRLAMTKAYAIAAGAAGDSIRHVEVPGANHFDAVDAASPFLTKTLEAVRWILSGAAKVPS